MMRIYDLETGDLVDTGVQSVSCMVDGCHSELPYRIKGNTISFFTEENPSNEGEGVDLDGDGDPTDVVLTVYSLPSRKAQTIAAVVDDGILTDASTSSPLPVEAVNGGSGLHGAP